jgi:hypothetical protein
MKSALQETELKNASDNKKTKISVLTGMQSEPAEIIPAGEMQFNG